MAQRSLSKHLWYEFLRVLCRLLGVAVFRIRVFGREYVPKQGGVLVVSNHQSHLDPVLVGLACDRRLNFVARDTLFGFAPFRWLINSLDAIPLDREGIGLGGLKESLRRLKDGEMLLIFPEGTRTRDGNVGELKPGFIALARRAKAPLLPVAIDGAFNSWPRTSVLPQPAVIHIRFGPPMMPEDLSQQDDATLMAEVEHRVQKCHELARFGRQQAIGLKSNSSLVNSSQIICHK